MEEFAFNASIDTNAGIQDKISLHISDWHIVGNLSAFQAALCAPSRRDRHLSPPYLEHRWIFEGAESLAADARYKRCLYVRKGNSSVLGCSAPLFSGQLEFTRLGVIDGQLHVKMEAFLFLNPTRYLHHYYHDRRASSSTHREHLTARQTLSCYDNDEYVLDDEQDNWIPHVRSHAPYSFPSRWDAVMRRYITAVSNCIQSEFDHAANLAIFEAGNVLGGQQPVRLITTQLKYNLKTIETYVEFKDNTPIDTVERISPLLESFGNQCSNSSLSIASLNGPIINSRCYRVYTQHGERLKVYAKTNRRIRFEVEHDLTNGSASFMPRHTFDTLEELFQGITMMRRRARNRITSALEHMRNRTSLPNWSPSPLEFIHALFVALPDKPAIVNDVLSLLVHNDGIRLAPHTPLAEALRTLKRRQILTFEDASRRYFAHEQYRHAVIFLREKMSDVVALNNALVTP